MRLESVRGLKAELMASRELTRVATWRALPVAARVVASALPQEAPPVPMALGIRGRRGRYRLAVRVQQVVPGLESMLEHIRRSAKGEVDVRVVGRIVKQQPWHRRHNRPLRIGGSIGHLRITAGTLGCFVTRAAEGVVDDLILSNNHVLANENLAKRGDSIIQPGKSDGGRSPRERVGFLDRFVPLKRRRNLVDAATAELAEGVSYYYNWLEGLGPIKGVRTDPLQDGERLFKLGRTTGLTEGRVSAIEVDDLLVGYDRRDLHFNDQIEIEPVGSQPFSLGGDSGSLIVDRRRLAVGLLFAGNDVDATYANPIETVLDRLRVRLVF
jgi:hypothetical protein